MWGQLWRNCLAHVKRVSIFKVKGGWQSDTETSWNSLLEQLRLRVKASEFYGDLVNDYVKYWGLKKQVNY